MTKPTNKRKGKNFQTRKNNIFSDLGKKRNTIFILAGIFFLVWTTSSFIIHNNYHSVFEIGIIEQALWNTLHGNFFDSISNAGNHFANHNSPILFLFLPFYAIFPSILTIFTINNLILALGVIPLFALSNLILKNSKISLALCISYLLFPSFYYINLRSFHPIMMAPTLILFSFYYLHKKNWKLFSVFSVLSIATNETVSLIFFMLGIYIFVVSKERKKALILATLSLLWFLFSLNIVIPFFSGEEAYRFLSQFYSHLGTTPLEIISSIIFHPIQSFFHGEIVEKITFLKVFFKHTVFFPFLGFDAFVISLPLLVQNLYSNSQYKYDFLAHYSFPLISIMFFSTIVGIKRFLAITQFKHFKKKLPKIFFWFLIIFSIVSFMNHGVKDTFKENCNLIDNLYETGKCPQTNDIIGNSRRENYPILDKAMSMIPKDASVSAQIHTFSHLSSRKETYLLDRFPLCSFSEYFLLDTSAPIPGKDDVSSYLKSVENIGYSLEYHEEDVYLFKRTTNSKLCVK